MRPKTTKRRTNTDKIKKFTSTLRENASEAVKTINFPQKFKYDQLRNFSKPVGPTINVKS